MKITGIIVGERRWQRVYSTTAEKRDGKSGV